MIIYIDENMPPTLAAGLNVLQEPENIRSGIFVEVKSIKTVFGKGAKDEEWIPLAGKQEACVITQDYNIQRTRHQKALCEENKLGLFFFRPPSKTGYSYWQMVELCIANWQQIVKIAAKEVKPFAYRCSARKPLEKI
jgi:hypothetical protein